MEKSISGPTGPRGRGPCKFTQRDLQRAMRAAQKEGMRVARFEIMQDGRISIVPLIEGAGISTEGATGPNEWDTE